MRKHVFDYEPKQLSIVPTSLPGVLEGLDYRKKISMEDVYKTKAMFAGGLKKRISVEDSRKRVWGSYTGISWDRSILDFAIDQVEEALISLLYENSIRLDSAMSCYDVLLHETFDCNLLCSEVHDEYSYLDTDDCEVRHAPRLDSVSSEEAAIGLHFNSDNLTVSFSEASFSESLKDGVFSKSLVFDMFYDFKGRCLRSLTNVVDLTGISSEDVSIYVKGQDKDD